MYSRFVHVNDHATVEQSALDQNSTDGTVYLTTECSLFFSSFFFFFLSSFFLSSFFLSLFAGVLTGGGGGGGGGVPIASLEKTKPDSRMGCVGW